VAGGWWSLEEAIPGAPTEQHRWPGWEDFIFGEFASGADAAVASARLEFLRAPAPWEQASSELDGAGTAAGPPVSGSVVRALMEAAIYRRGADAEASARAAPTEAWNAQVGVAGMLLSRMPAVLLPELGPQAASHALQICARLAREPGSSGGDGFSIALGVLGRLASLIQAMLQVDPQGQGPALLRFLCPGTCPLSTPRTPSLRPSVPSRLIRPRVARRCFWSSRAIGAAAVAVRGYGERCDDRLRAELVDLAPVPCGVGACPLSW
jgi:hypothetical protein